MQGDPERFETEVAVIGAGVVGLAISAELARRGRSVVILERGAAVGAETSSRNSEVIHAGLYYETGSLKARACVAGRDMLYAWCAARGVPHRRCGKLIVATEPDEEGALERIVAQAASAGVAELDRLSGAQAQRMEPELHAVSALWSPLTGIVDSHSFMLSLLGEAESNGAALALNAPVARGGVEPGGVRLEIGGAAPALLTARIVVNAAGLWAQDVAGRIDGPHQARIPPKIYAKGSYFALSGVKAPFARLIYPAPVPGGLGVHLTLDLGGAGRFGPDVEFLDTEDPDVIDYSVDPARGGAFYAAIRRYWPALPDGALRPDYAGARPKIDPRVQKDFRIDGPAEHGADGLFNLFGFESPALTGALAIGAHVADRVDASER